MRSSVLRAATMALLAAVVAPACSDDVDDLFNDPPAEVPETFAPAPGGLRRLLAGEYVDSIRVLLGDAAAAAATPPPDSSLHGFESIAAAELSLSPSAVATYEASARAAALAAVTDPAALASILPCQPTGTADAACHRQLVERFGRLAWRRPLDTAELDRITAIAQAAATAYGDFNTGVLYAVSAILQSPNFIYLVEVGEPDPDDPAVRRLTPHELVARMSFFLLDQTPDAALLDAADQGPLDDEALRALARQLVARPESRAALERFWLELLRIRDLEDVSKSQDLFPQWSQDLAHAMKEETLRLLEDVIWTRDTDARELLVADYTWVNQDLAALYGVAPPAGGDFTRVTLPASQNRSGLLSTSAFLSRFAHPDINSPTRRGLFVKDILLCEEVAPPPPGVNTTLPEPSGEVVTLRKRLEQHMAIEGCGGCHSQMDPIGFALENYDAIGAYRTEDNGIPIDSAVTDVLGIGTFASARELGLILRDDPRVTMCMVKNVLRSSLGHLETEGEMPAIEAVHEAFGASGFRVQELLVELVASPAFRLVGEPK